MQGRIDNIPWRKKEALGEAEARPGQVVNLRDGRPQTVGGMRAGGPTRQKEKLDFPTTPPRDNIRYTHLDGVDFFFFAAGGAVGEPAAPPPSEESPCPDMDLFSASRKLDMLDEERRAPVRGKKKGLLSFLSYMCSYTEIRLRAQTARLRPYARRAMNFRKIHQYQPHRQQNGQRRALSLTTRED